MALPAPHLDDRTFQSLVDDAKRMIHQRCPEWTDRTYIKFLELLGLRLNPPTAARVPVTFWLSAPQQEPQLVPAVKQVATPRSEDEPVVFSTVEDLSIVN